MKGLWFPAKFRRRLAHDTGLFNQINHNKNFVKMSRKRKCTHGSVYFRFELPLTSEGVFFDNLTIDGYGCRNLNGMAEADIDSVEFQGVEVKPLLEILGGMHEIDAAAEDHVRGLFEISQIKETELV